MTYRVIHLATAHGDFRTYAMLHEAFHAFQFSANSPGFRYTGASFWYVETTADWYTINNNPTGITTFSKAGVVIANPHLALWHSLGTEAPGDYNGSIFRIRPYAVDTLLWYLTDVKGVDSTIITEGFYANTDLYPQEYIFNRIGKNISILSSHHSLSPLKDPP